MLVTNPEKYCKLKDVLLGAMCYENSKKGLNELLRGLRVFIPLWILSGSVSLLFRRKPFLGDFSRLGKLMAL